ncbi:MAG TPA: type B 50S ribosomal protein L31 [Candidatus Saccharimonadales bacterium]|jgi:large subunit ribosomal protein L31|nr:type B 50S ribosomal protein L31 [Candidatus Saccharimonadales bacterium]
MKKGLHPSNYRPVVFQDLNNSQAFLTRSTIETEETIVWEDGKEYPLAKVHITSSSHPFFTGEERVLDIEGRVDKFKARAAAGKAAREKLVSAAAKKRQAPKKSEPKDTDSKSK